MYTGLTAKLEIKTGSEAAAATVAYVSNWSVEETRDIIEVTKLGSKAKEKKPSLYSWTASAEGTVDFGSTTNQKAFRDAMIAGTPISVTFYLDETVKFSGTAYIESMSVDISAEDKGNISISLNGDGELTLSTGASA